MDNTHDQQEQKSIDTEQPDASVPIQAVTDDDTVSLIDLLAVLANRWRLIFFASFFAAIGIVLFSIYTIRIPADSPYNPLPNVYGPEAQILLVDPDSSNSVASAIGGDLGFLAGLAAAGGGKGAQSAALAQTLLTGNWIVDRIIDEFGLLDEYADAEFPRTAARGFVRGNLQTEFDELTGILTVSFQHIDAVYATDVLQRAVDLLEARFIDLTRDDARARTTAVQAQIQQLEDDLSQARDAMITFQTRYGVIDPRTQGAQTLELITQYQIQVHGLERQREQYLSYIEESEAPQVQRINREIELIEELITELETGFHVYSPIGIPRNQIGQLTTIYLDLQRDLALKENIYSTFRAELVRAQIESQDTSRRFQVIEPPEVPQIKSSPNRGMICIIVTITAFFLSVFLAFVLEYFDKARSDPREADKLEIIRDQFRFRKKRS